MKYINKRINSHNSGYGRGDHPDDSQFVWRIMAGSIDERHPERKGAEAAAYHSKHGFGTTI